MYYILSNNADCQDLSIWKCDTTDKSEAVSEMRNIAVETMLNAGKDHVRTFDFDAENGCAYIIFTDECTENFRIVDAKDIEKPEVGQIDTVVIQDPRGNIYITEEDVDAFFKQITEKGA